MRRFGVAVVPNFVSHDTCTLLLEELEGCRWGDVESHKGKRRVRQEFQAAMEFKTGGFIIRIRDELEAYLNMKFARCRRSPLSRPLCFNWVVAQRYTPESVGIGPHRDGAQFADVIALLVLDGEGGLWVCDDLDGSAAAPVPNEAGTLILLKGCGFAGSRKQPIHYVSRVARERTVLAFRHMVRDAQPPRER